MVYRGATWHNDATGVTTPRQRVKASPHRHKWMLSHGAPADPSDPWNSHAAPVSPRQNGQRGVVAVAKGGAEDGYPMIAGSIIVNPDGEIVAEAKTEDDE